MRQETLQQFGILQVRVLGVECLRRLHAPLAKGQHAEDNTPPRAGHRDHITIEQPMCVDLGLLHGVLDGADPVANECRLLVQHLLAVLLHLLSQQAQDFLRLAAQEHQRLFHIAPIDGRIHAADARRAAAVDLVQDARSRAVLQLAVAARSNREQPLQEADRLLHVARAGVRAEIQSLVPTLALACAVQPRPFVSGVEPQGDVRLVVAKLHIIARLVLFDQRVLEKERILLRVRDHRLD